MYTGIHKYSKIGYRLQGTVGTKDKKKTKETILRDKYNSASVNLELHPCHVIPFVIMMKI